MTHIYKLATLAVAISFIGCAKSDDYLAKEGTDAVVSPVTECAKCDDYLAKGDDYIKKSDFAGAIREYQKAIVKAPTKKFAYQKLAAAYIKAESSEEAWNVARNSFAPPMSMVWCGTTGGYATVSFGGFAQWAFEKNRKTGMYEGYMRLQTLSGYNRMYKMFSRVEVTSITPSELRDSLSGYGNTHNSLLVRIEEDAYRTSRIGKLYLVASCIGGMYSYDPEEIERIANTPAADIPTND